jgi:hypothetical protein
VSIAPEHEEYLKPLDPAAFLEGGNYTVFQVVESEELENGEHIVCALRRVGIPHLWIVQENNVFQANGAKAMLEDCMVLPPEGSDEEPIKFQWGYWCSALASVQEARRVLLRTQNMFPELKWVMVWDYGEGQKMTGWPHGYAAKMKKGVDSVGSDEILAAAKAEFEAKMN